MRLLALLVLLAVLPTAELAEQAIHLVEHALEGEAPDHSAHHDGAPGDEHGCTGLVHLCTCHHAQVTAAIAVTATPTLETLDRLAAEVPPPLSDLHSLEPAQRPPNG
jgi:hypothetical protein